MVNYINKYLTLSDYEADETKQYPNVSYIAENDEVIFMESEPIIGSTCYEIISTPITSYTATTYDSVYSFSDTKWYMKNNIGGYEEYGVYDTGSSLSDFTYYDGKLVAIGTTEYQRSGDTWVEVGTCEDESTTLELNEEGDYQGITISPPFKIPTSDFEEKDITIYGDSDGLINFNLASLGSCSYSDYGTITDDGTYYNYSLQVISSFTISRIDYYGSGTIHLIVSPTDTIDITEGGDYEGITIPTTFKILKSEIQDNDISFFGDNDNFVLGVTEDSYNYFENGTMTEESEDEDSFYIFTFPLASSITIDHIDGLDDSTIHLKAGGMHATVEYLEKTTPSYSIYSTVQEMEAVGCPNVGVNEYAFVGNDLYKYFANEEWDGVTYYDPKMVAFYENEDPLVVYDNNNSTLEQSETKITDISPISVYIGDIVTNIGDNAFDSCTSLTSIDIPSGVTNIGDYAFSDCTSLTSIDIPSGVTSIGDNAFDSCTSLTSITILDSVTSIGGGAFNNCRSLTSIDIPSGVTSIGESVFGWCTSLTSIDIPSGVTSIGGGAFSVCISLTSIVIPDSVTSIGDDAFYGCSGLITIIVRAIVPPELGSNAFANTNNAQILVPSESVDTYKSAEGWSEYADRIQAIP